MGRPPKPTNIIELEKVSHRTKEELKTRKEAENALITGVHMRIWPEVQSNPVAKKEFNRVKKLLGVIDKDDGLHESAVNRYALLKAECVEFEEKRESFYRSKSELEEEYKNQVPQLNEENGKMELDLKPSTYYKLLATMQKSIIDIDKQIMSKRNMMLAIEKENLMTIASALRSIPKTPPKKEEKTGMAAFLSKRAEAK